MTANPLPRLRSRALAALVAVVLAAVVAPVVIGNSVAGADAVSDKKAEAQQIAGKIYDLDLKIEEYAEAANGAQVQQPEIRPQLVDDPPLRQPDGPRHDRHPPRRRNGRRRHR